MAAQKNYAAHKGELFAVVYFTEHFRPYLSYRPFVLRTDHNALKYLDSMKPPTGMVARWMDLLASFRFTVQHRPGTQHGNADALSRRPALPTLEEGALRTWATGPSAA